MIENGRHPSAEALLPVPPVQTVAFLSFLGGEYPMWMYAWGCTHARVHPHPHARMCGRVCIHMHRRACVRVHAYARALVYAYMRTRMHAHACAHVCADGGSWWRRLGVSDGVLGVRTHPCACACMCTRICMGAYVHSLQ